MCVYTYIENEREGGMTLFQMSYLLLPLSPMHAATPLIILPVQSEGVPSSSGGVLAGAMLPTSPPSNLQGEELKKLLVQQLEYYFSKDNLSSDKYLCKFDVVRNLIIEILSLCFVM